MTSAKGATINTLRNGIAMKALPIVCACLLLAVLNPTWAAEPSVVTANGTVEPSKSVDVSASMPGIIAKLGTEPGNGSNTIDYGAHVKEGAILAEFDQAPYE